MPNHNVTYPVAYLPGRGHNRRVPEQTNNGSSSDDLPPNGEQSEDVTSEIISNRFREFLIKDKNMPPGRAVEIAGYLDEFIKQNREMIGGDVVLSAALGTLRKTVGPIKEGDYPKYSERSSYGIEDPRDWYDRFYRSDVDSGLLNTSSLIRIDRSFTHYLTEALKPEQTLAEFMGLKRQPSLKVKAMSVVLDTTPEMAAAFLHSMKGGRPAKR